MPISKAQMRAVQKYVAANYDRLAVRVPKGRRAEIETFANARGESTNALINNLVRQAMGVSEDEWRAVSEQPNEQETEQEAAHDTPENEPC